MLRLKLGIEATAVLCLFAGALGCHRGGDWVPSTPVRYQPISREDDVLVLDAKLAPIDDYTPIGKVFVRTGNSAAAMHACRAKAAEHGGNAVIAGVVDRGNWECSVLRRRGENDGHTASEPPDTKHALVPLWGSGLGLLGGVWLTTWVVTAVVASDSCRGASTGEATIPLIGPWIVMGDDGGRCVETQAQDGALIASGVLQTLGVGLLAAGLLIKVDGRGSAILLEPRANASTAAMDLSVRF